MSDVPLWLGGIGACVGALATAYAAFQSRSAARSASTAVEGIARANQRARRAQSLATMGPVIELVWGWPAGALVVSSGIDSVVLLAISGILTDGSVVSGVKISANGRPAFRVVVPGSERVDPRMLVDHVTVDYTDQLDAAQWRIEAPVAAIADAGKWMGQTHTAKPIG